MVNSRLEFRELRCPASRHKLLAKVSSNSSFSVSSENLIEVSCSSCAKELRRSGRGGVIRVLHRFNLLGEFVETCIVE